MITYALSSPDLIDVCEHYLRVKQYPNVRPLRNVTDLVLHTLNSSNDNVVVFTTALDSELFMYLMENRRSLGSIKIFTNNRGVGMVYNNAQFDVYRVSDNENIPLDNDFNSYQNILKLDRTGMKSFTDLFKFDINRPVTAVCYDTVLKKVLNEVKIDYRRFNPDNDVSVDRSPDRIYRIVNVRDGVIFGKNTASELARQREHEQEFKQASQEAQDFDALRGFNAQKTTGVQAAVEAVLGISIASRDSSGEVVQMYAGDYDPSNSRSGSGSRDSRSGSRGASRISHMDPNEAAQGGSSVAPADNSDYDSETKFEGIQDLPSAPESHQDDVDIIDSIKSESEAAATKVDGLTEGVAPVEVALAKAAPTTVTSVEAVDSAKDTSAENAAVSEASKTSEPAMGSEALQNASQVVEAPASSTVPQVNAPNVISEQPKAQPEDVSSIVSEQPKAQPGDTSKPTIDVSKLVKSKPSISKQDQSDEQSESNASTESDASIESDASTESDASEPKNEVKSHPVVDLMKPKVESNSQLEPQSTEDTQPVLDQPESDTQSAAKSDAKPEDKLEAKSEDKLDAKPEVKSEVTSSVSTRLFKKPEVSIQSQVAQPQMNAQVFKKPQVQSQAQPQAKSQVQAQAQPQAKSQVQAQARPQTNPQQSQAQPQARPQTNPQQVSKASFTPDPRLLTIPKLVVPTYRPPVRKNIVLMTDTILANRAEQKQRILSDLKTAPLLQAPITKEFAAQIIDQYGPVSLLSYQAREEIRAGLWDLGSVYDRRVRNETPGESKDGKPDEQVSHINDPGRRGADSSISDPGKRKKATGSLISNPGELSENQNLLSAPKIEGKVTGELIRRAEMKTDGDDELLTPAELDAKLREQALKAAKAAEAAEATTGDIVKPEMDLSDEASQISKPEDQEVSEDLIAEPIKKGLFGSLIKPSEPKDTVKKPKGKKEGNISKPVKGKTSQRIEVASGDYMQDAKVSKVYVADEAINMAQKRTANEVESDVHASQIIASAIQEAKDKQAAKDEKDRHLFTDNSKSIKGFIKKDSGLKGALKQLFNGPEEQPDEFLEDVNVAFDFSSLRNRDILNESDELGFKNLYGTQVTIYKSIEDKLIQEGLLSEDDVKALQEEQRQMKLQKNVKMTLIEVAVLLEYLPADVAIRALSEFTGSEVMSEEDVMSCDIVSDVFKQDVCKKYCFFVTTGIDGRSQFVTWMGNNLEYSLGSHYFNAVERYTLRQYIMKRIKTWDKW